MDSVFKMKIALISDVQLSGIAASKKFKFVYDVNSPLLYQYLADGGHTKLVSYLVANG